MSNPFTTVVDGYNLKLLTQNDSGVFAVVLANTDGRFELYAQTCSIINAKTSMQQAKDEHPERAVYIYTRSRNKLVKVDEIPFV